MSLSPASPIGLFDSGIGGLTVAKAVAQRLPNESLLYFGDTARSPYGTKPQHRIKTFSFEIAEYLKNEGCKMLVVACNTASAAALNDLRKHWPDWPIVGMEPAVKPGAMATKTGVVGVLATAGTFESHRYADLMYRFARHIDVLENPCRGLVKLIEDGKMTAPETEKLLRNALEPMTSDGADTIVLGCTHYPFVRDLIQEIAGPHVSIIDPAPAVARQVERLLKKKKLLNTNGKSKHHFTASSLNENFKRAVQLYFQEGEFSEVLLPCSAL